MMQPRTLAILIASMSFAADADAKTFGVVKQADSGNYVSIGAHGGLDVRGEDVPTIDADADGSRFNGGPALNTQVRLGLDAEYQFSLGALPVIAYGAFETDLWSGYLNSDHDLDAVELPGSKPQEHQIRKGFGRLSFGPFLTLAGGVMTSQWGLGMLANDGDNVWTPTSAAFVDPRGGDVVKRGLVATGPWTAGQLTIYGFFDEVVADTTLRPGDEAEQFGGGFRIGDKRRGLGLYFVHRDLNASDGDTLVADVADIYAYYGWPIGRHKLHLETEIAAIVGETTFAPNVDHPQHDVLQLAGAVRGKYEASGWGAVLDAIWASGDQNLDDAELNAFKADPNYEMGLLLFRRVLGTQSARAPVTASDPTLVGEPAEDLDRIPTQGTVTNTLALFPRLYWQPIPSIEVYGGPLFAFADSSVIDPLNTRLNGGEPHNALGGTPSGYLGTELDLGARAHLDLDETIFSAGIEGALLFPGEAFVDASGTPMDTLFGARAMARYQF